MLASARNVYQLLTPSRQEITAGSKRLTGSTDQLSDRPLTVRPRYCEGAVGPAADAGRYPKQG
jgi:hypothetical protein